MSRFLAPAVVVIVLLAAVWLVAVVYRRMARLVRHPVLRPLVEDGTIDLSWILAYARQARDRSRLGTSPYACVAWLLVMVDLSTPGADRVARLYLREAIRRGPPFWLVALPGVPAGLARAEDVPVLVLSEPAERARATEQLRKQGVAPEGLELPAEVTSLRLSVSPRRAAHLARSEVSGQAPLEAAAWVVVTPLDATHVTPMEVSRSFDQALRIRRALAVDGALDRVARWCREMQASKGGTRLDAERFVADLERVARGDGASPLARSPSARSLP